MTAQIIGNARFTLLSDTLVRMEYAPDGRFEDRPSIRAINRPEPRSFEETDNRDGKHVLVGGRFHITYIPDGKPFWNWNVFVHNRRTRELVWQMDFVDDLNLGGVHRTLNRMNRDRVPHSVHTATSQHHANDDTRGLDMLKFDGTDGEEALSGTLEYPPAILSKRGYFLYNDTPTEVLGDRGQLCSRDAHPDYQDLYLFLYDKDYAQALADYRLLFGATTLPPRYMLGLWYARFPTLQAREIDQTVADFERYELPLDVFVLDLEWHTRGWHGFDWNEDEYGRPGEFLGNLHDKDIRVTANVHPCMVPVEDSRYEAFLEASGIRPREDDIVAHGRGKVTKLQRFSLSDRRVADAWMDVFHKPVQDEGLDFWWQDGAGYDH
ncbi:MAG: hypothetical protein GF331_02425, partial [Chitinivibrionales bacterium]|nr:hypothetical protein [Chitinivibrionales bacterium]